MKKVKVLVLTPYLSKYVESESLRREMIRYISEPDNPNPEFSLPDIHEPIIMAPKYCNGGRREVSRINPGISLVIAGSTREGEQEVSKHRGTGLIFARYSIFYGGESDYTGNSPEDVGYALDFPKSEDVVRDFLTDKRILSALVLRKEELIWEAIDEFNFRQDRPVLITPYLHEALAV